MKKSFREWRLRAALSMAERLSDDVLAFFVSEAILRYARCTGTLGKGHDELWDLVDFLLPNPPEKDRAIE